MKAGKLMVLKVPESSFKPQNALSPKRRFSTQQINKNTAPSTAATHQEINQISNFPLKQKSVFSKPKRLTPRPGQQLEKVETPRFAVNTLSWDQPEKKKPYLRKNALMDYFKNKNLPLPIATKLKTKVTAPVSTSRTENLSGLDDTSYKIHKQLLKIYNNKTIKSILTPKSAESSALAKRAQTMKRASTLRKVGKSPRKVRHIAARILSKDRLKTEFPKDKLIKKDYVNNDYDEKELQASHQIVLDELKAAKWEFEKKQERLQGRKVKFLE